jgi:hypothetical protein
MPPKPPEDSNQNKEPNLWIIVSNYIEENYSSAQILDIIEGKIELYDILNKFSEYYRTKNNLTHEEIQDWRKYHLPQIQGKIIETLSRRREASQTAQIEELDKNNKIEDAKRHEETLLNEGDEIVTLFDPTGGKK